MRHAYGFDQVAYQVNGQQVAADGTGHTIAISTAYHDPNIYNDLRTFNTTFGLSNLDGAGNYVLSVVLAPSGVQDANWALETSLDVQWAHAVAPGAHILLVEAASISFSDLMGAVNYARYQPGVVTVSMSWGTSEFAGEWNYDPYFQTPEGHVGGWGMYGGITFVSAASDSGGSAGWPAISPSVLSVGGTTLRVDQQGNYLGESAWSGGGGGPGKYMNNVAPFVAYAADPAIGYLVYSSTLYQGHSGWWTVGGNIAGAPQWAGLIAIVSQGRGYAGYGSLDGATQLIPQLLNLPQSDFNDIANGENGTYAAASGFDSVTGRGTPPPGRLRSSVT